MATKITDSILLNWFGSDQNKKQMFLSVPGGPDTNEGGVLFLECVDSGGDADGGLFLFTDGSELRYSTTKPTNTNTGGSSLGTATSSALNRYMSNLEPTACNTSIISDTDSTDNLGSSSILWANTYTDKIWLNATAAIDGTSTASTSTVAGNWHFGVNGTGVDVILYGDTAGSNCTWDMSADSLILTDDALVVFGDASDMWIEWDGTDAELDFAAANSTFNFGATGASDLVLHGGTAGSDVTWDASANILSCLDDVKLAFGDADDMYFNFDATDLELRQTAAGTGNFKIGVDNAGIDCTWFAETTGDYMKWDQNGNTNVGALIFEDSVIQFAGANVTYTYTISTDEMLLDGTDAATCGITFGTAGTHGMDVLFQSITAGDTIAFDAGGKTLTFADVNLVMGAEYIQFYDDAIKISSVNGQLDIDADVEVEIATATLDVNATATEISGTLAVTGMQTNTGGIQSASVARTATDDGTTTGTIADGTVFVTLDADSDANHICILPTPTPGNIVYITEDGATGYELRSSTTASVAINGGTGAAAESPIAGATTYIRCVCVSATSWICNQWDADGDESKVTAAS